MKIKKNGKVINLTESDLKRIVKKVLTEDAPFDPMVNVEDLEFKIFVNRKDITGSVSKPKLMGTNNYFRVDIESDEGVWSPNDVVTLKITGGNLGGERIGGGTGDVGKKLLPDGVMYFTEVGDHLTRMGGKYSFLNITINDTNLKIEEGQEPTLSVRVNLNGRDRDFDEKNKMFHGR